MSLQAPRWAISACPARLVKSVDLLASIPGQPITGNPSGDRAAVKGYYRLIDQADESAVTPENILAPHRSRTLQRMRDQDTVLCIQDGTDLSFATRPGCEGLQVIGRNQTSAKTEGLHLHLTLATTGEGLPLGVLRCGFDPAEASDDGDEAEHGVAVEDDAETKIKSQRWIQGLQDIARAARELTGRTRVISVMEPRSGFFRAVRRTAPHRKGRRAGPRQAQPHSQEGCSETVRSTAQCAPLRPDRSRDRARDRTPKVQPQEGPARAQQAERPGRCPPAQLRPCRPPSPEPNRFRSPPSICAKPTPRKTSKRSNGSCSQAIQLNDFEDATRIIAAYLRRWRIEDLFRVLKSGCKAEHAAFRSACRLQRSVTINAVIGLAHHAHDAARTGRAGVSRRAHLQRP